MLKQLISRLLIAAVASGAAGASFAAENFPTRPVRIVVPFAPGGSTDMIARLMAEKLREHFKQSFVVENRPGANGVIGAQLVAASPADGYTLMAIGGSTLTSVFLKKPPFDFMRTFTPVSSTHQGALVIVSSAATPASTLPEFIDLAKRHPGKLNFGYSSANTMLAMIAFNKLVGVDIALIPYKGSALVTGALLANEVQASIDGGASNAASVEAGRLKALAVAGPRRLSMLPGVPTTAEAGLPAFKTLYNGGLWAPAGMPKEVVASLNDAVNQILKSKEVQEKIRGTGAEPTGGEPQVFARNIQEEMDFWAQSAKLANYKPD